MRQTCQTFRYAVFTVLLTLVLFLTPFDLISNAQSSVNQEASDIASALDNNQNRVLDDAEILNAIQLWILGEAPPDGEMITDESILSLVQLWITGESISSPLLMGDDVGGAAETPTEVEKLYWAESFGLGGIIKSCEIANCYKTTTTVLRHEDKHITNLFVKYPKLYWLNNEQEKVESCDIRNCHSSLTDVWYFFLGIQKLQMTFTDTHLYMSDVSGRITRCELANCMDKGSIVTDIGPVSLTSISIGF